MGVVNAPGNLRAAPPPPDSPTRQRLFSGYGGHDEKDRPRAMESVRVAARVRPHAAADAEGASGKPCATAAEDAATINVSDGRKYFFDHVFGPDAPQARVYAAAAKPLLLHFLEGYNCTIVAYGQTGSGKTYTMGTDAAVGPRAAATEMGILPRLAEDLFVALSELRRRGAILSGLTTGDAIPSGKERFAVDVRCQFLEIYNNEIRDLLADRAAKPSAVTLRESGRDIVVGGAVKFGVPSVEALMAAFQTGCRLRTTGATQMNERSSRSHAIFTIYLEQSHTDGGGASSVLRSKFHLVDLAGSERQKKTGAQGQRFTESKNINMGLLALGNVISALGDKARRAAHVPYRESLITRLLQDSLGGNSKTLVIACCSGHERNRDETLNTLKYANRARNIKNAPVKVSALTMEEISALQRSLEAMVHETLRNGRPAQEPEALISRLDPQSLFAAMVAIAQNLMAMKAPEAAQEVLQVDEVAAASRLSPRALSAASGEVLRSPPAAQEDERRESPRHASGLSSAEHYTGSAVSTADRKLLESATDTTHEHLKAMSNSLLVLQSEHAELLRCVRTTSAVLRDVMGSLHGQQLVGEGPAALGKLRTVCRSLDALTGMAASHPEETGDLQYEDEVQMTRALEGLGLVGTTDGQLGPSEVSADGSHDGFDACCLAGRSAERASTPPRPVPCSPHKNSASPNGGFWTSLLHAIRGHTKSRKSKSRASAYAATSQATATPSRQTPGASARASSVPASPATPAAHGAEQLSARAVSQDDNSGPFTAVAGASAWGPPSPPGHLVKSGAAHRAPRPVGERVSEPHRLSDSMRAPHTPDQAPAVADAAAAPTANSAESGAARRSHSGLHVTDSSPGGLAAVAAAARREYVDAPGGAQRGADPQAPARASPQLAGPRSLGGRASPAGAFAGEIDAAAGPRPYSPVGRVHASYDGGEDAGPRTAPAGSGGVANPSRSVLQQEFQRLEALMQKL